LAGPVFIDPNIFVVGDVMSATQYSAVKIDERIIKYSRLEWHT